MYQKNSTHSGKEQLMKDVHKGGRPSINLPAEFYKAILAEYDNQLTIRQIADAHKVSRSTVNRWLRKARNMEAATAEDGQTKPTP